MKKQITLSSFVIAQTDLESIDLIATRFLDLDGNEIFISFEDGWYSDDAICYNDLFDRGLSTKALEDFAKRYHIFLMKNEDGEIELKSITPVSLLQTIIAVYFWIDEQSFPVHDQIYEFIIHFWHLDYNMVGGAFL